MGVFRDLAFLKGLSPNALAATAVGEGDLQVQRSFSRIVLRMGNCPPRPFIPPSSGLSTVRCQYQLKRQKSRQYLEKTKILFH